MKRLIALLMAIVFVLALCACGNNSEQSAPQPEQNEQASSNEGSTQKTKLVLWQPVMASGETLDQEFWETALAPWAAANNVDLSISITPWDNYEERYLTAFSSGEGPDVGYMYNEMLANYIENGQLATLDQFLTDADKENYTMLGLGQINGVQQTLPFAPGGARVMFANMDILKEAGIDTAPTNWQEFIDACVAIKNANIDGLVSPYIAAWGDDAIGLLNACYYPFMWQAGGALLDGDASALTSNDGAVKAAQFIYDLKFKYQVLADDCTSYTDSDCANLFTEGKVAFLCAPDHNYSTFDAANVNWEFCGPGNIGHLEMVAGSGAETFTAADCLVMNSACKNKDLAWSLMKEMTSPAVADQVREKLYVTPSLTNDAKNFLTEKQAALYAAGESLNSLPVSQNSVAAMEQLKSNLQLMLLGDLTPEQAIQNTSDYIDSLN